MSGKNYKNDREFLARHLETVELRDGERRVSISPSLQGRVMTSTCGGDDGYSFGWINYDLIESGKFLPHCNNFGGEDRYWLGPEGGQFSLFFKKESDFSFDDWQTPPVIDTEKWELVEHCPVRASFRKDTVIENYAGRKLSCRLERSVSLLSDSEIEELLGMKLPKEVEYVSFQSENKLTNTGDFGWNKQTGMLSIWILGQFIPSGNNTVIIPFKEAKDEKINDAYFGKIPSDRLTVKGNTLYFKGDGGMRGKIGVPAGMTVPVCGAIDRENGTLTIVKFSFDPSKADYVNSMWEHQAEPFRGDVINSYNDGPLEDSSVMGPFYELETSSAAANLKPGETLVHNHTTIHLKANVEVLEKIAGGLIK